MAEFRQLKDDLDDLTEREFGAREGYKVLTQLVTTYLLFCKSCARDLCINSLYAYFFFVVRMNDTLTNDMMTVALTPFGVKTLWGAFSDALPFCGYHKRYYILWAVTVSCMCVMGLAFTNEDPTISYKVDTKGNLTDDRCGPTIYEQLTASDSPVPPGYTCPGVAPPEENENGDTPGGPITCRRKTLEELPKAADSQVKVGFAALLFFGFEYGGATVDSLTQARYTELMNMMGKPTIVSFVWFLIQMSGILTWWSSFLLVPGYYKFLLPGVLPLAAPMLYPAASNWLFEKPAASTCSPDVEKLVEHRGIFGMSMWLAFGALGSAVTLLVGLSTSLKLIYIAIVAGGYLTMSFIFLPPKIAKPAFYMFLCSTMRLWFSGTLQTWYVGSTYAQAEKTALEATCFAKGAGFIDSSRYCIVDGPGFSLGYYQAAGTLCGAVAGLVAVFIFEKFVVKWNVRAAFWVTTVFQVGASLIEVSMLERWNHGLFGTDPFNLEDGWVDNIFFLFGSQAIEKIVEMLDFMPCNVLIGKLCPANMEATIFAVLAGSQNFGSSLARIFGSIFAATIGISFAQSNVCDNPVYPFLGLNLKALTITRIVAGMMMTSLTIPFTFIFLPDKGLSDSYLDDDDVEMADPTGNDGAAPLGEGKRTQTIGSLPRGPSNISATSFVSMASMTKQFNTGQQIL